MDLRDFQTTIYGERIALRILKEEDASDDYCAWLNDPEVNRFLATKRTTIGELRDYILEKKAQKDILFFGIFLKKNNKHIGTVKLEPIDWSKKKATVAIMIGDRNYWNKGMATEAVNIITKYSFETFKLKEINLGVASGNKTAIRVYEKCGFEIYKIEPGAIDYCDRIYDQVLMKKTIPIKPVK